MLSSLVITFLPRSKHLLISWLQSPSAVILEPPKIKSDTVSPSICHEMMGLDDTIFILWMLNFKPACSLSSFTFIKKLFSFSSLSAIIGDIICISEVIDISLGDLDSSLCFIQSSILHDVILAFKEPEVLDLTLKVSALPNAGVISVYLWLIQALLDYFL